MRFSVTASPRLFPDLSVSQLHGDRGPLPWRGLDGESPAQLFDALAHGREPEAALVLRPDSGPALRRIESDAVVDHVDDDPVVHVSECYIDPAGACVFVDW